MNNNYKQEMIAEFRIDGFDGEVIYWNYTYEDYSGHADGYYVSKGKLYYVNGSHCSCYGLEGQFEPEEVTIEELKAQAERISGSYSLYGDSVREVLRYFEVNGTDIEMIEMMLILSN